MHKKVFGRQVGVVEVVGLPVAVAEVRIGKVLAQIGRTGGRKFKKKRIN